MIEIENNNLKNIFFKHSLIMRFIPGFNYDGTLIFFHHDADINELKKIIQDDNNMPTLNDEQFIYVDNIHILNEMFARYKQSLSKDSIVISCQPNNLLRSFNGTQAPCYQTWMDLDLTNDSLGTRYCSRCEKTIYSATTYEKVINCIQNEHPVALINTSLTEIYKKEIERLDALNNSNNVEDDLYGDEVDEDELQDDLLSIDYDDLDENNELNFSGNDCKDNTTIDCEDSPPLSTPEIIDPPTCERIERYLCGPINWKIINKINYLLASDTKKMDFVDIMIHPKGYLCVRRGAIETIFGFEYRIPIKDINLPITTTSYIDEDNNENNSTGIIISTKSDENVIQIVQFVHEKKPDTDLGYSSGLCNKLGIQMTDIEKAHEVAELLNTLIDNMTNNPTLTFAKFPPYWED